MRLRAQGFGLCQARWQRERRVGSSVGLDVLLLAEMTHANVCRNSSDAPKMQKLEAGCGCASSVLACACEACGLIL